MQYKIRKMERKVQIVEVQNNRRGQYASGMDSLFNYLKEGFDIHNSTVYGNTIIYILIKTHSN